MRSRGTISNKMAALALMTAILSGPALAATLDDLSTYGAPNRATEAPSLPAAGAGLSIVQTNMLNQAAQAFDESRFAAAESLLRRLTDQAPDQPDAWYILGLTLANLGQMDQAIAALDTAAGLYTSNAAPLVIKGDILTALDRADEAQQAYRDALERDPDNWLARESLAISYEKLGQDRAAIQQYRIVLDGAPVDRLYPRYRLAELMLRADRPADAAEVLAAYVDAVPDDVIALAALGLTQMASGMTAAAAESYGSAVAIAPDQPDLVLRLGQAQKADGQNDAALQTLRVGLERHPGHAGIAYELGTLQGALGDYEAAATSLQTTLQATPDDRRALKAMSLVRYRQGNRAEALPLAEKLTLRDDRTSGDFVWLGVLHEESGATDAAIQAYDGALKLDDSNWLAANNLAALLTRTDPARAVELARLATTHAGDVAAVKDTLGSALLASGDPADAIEIFRDLVAAEPENALYVYRLGKSHLALGNTEDAKRELNHALTLDPDFRYAAEARDLIAAN